MQPKLIEGNIFSDHRGSVSFVNNFKFNTIERFYVIKNSENQAFRGWQGHKLDEKNFYCVVGSFQVFYIKIDDWDKPSLDLKIESVVLTASESKILCLPPGYANAIKSLNKDSKLISFSTLPLDQVANDDVRFDKNYWKIDE